MNQGGNLRTPGTPAGDDYNQCWQVLSIMTGWQGGQAHTAKSRKSSPGAPNLRDVQRASTCYQQGPVPQYWWAAVLHTGYAISAGRSLTD